MHSLTENYPDNEFGTPKMTLTSAPGLFSLSVQLTENEETCWSL